MIKGVPSGQHIIIVEYDILEGGLIVVLFWGSQHFVIPFIPDAKYLIARYLIAAEGRLPGS